MTKLKEIIDYYVPPICQGSWYEDMMKEYAEYFAKECLKIAAEKASCSLYIKSVHKKKDKYKKVEDGESWNIMDYKQMSKVDKDSILNIKLPEHD